MEISNWSSCDGIIPLKYYEKSFYHRRVLSIETIRPKRYDELLNYSSIRQKKSRSCKLLMKRHYDDGVDRETFLYIKKSICMNDDSINDKKHNKVGGLLDLFNSDLFDIHLLLYYLNNREESGINDILINNLSNRFESKVLYYLPQLISIFLMKKDNEGISKFLLDYSFHSITFGLKLKWLMENYKTKVNNKAYQSKISQFLTKLYSLRIISIRQYNTFSSSYDNHNALKYRLIYQNKVEEFYQDIGSLYDVFFKRIKIDDSDILLKEIIDKFNLRIRNINSIANEINLSKNKSNHTLSIVNIFRGITFPFSNSGSRYDDISINDHDMTIIGNIIGENSSIYEHTKNSFVIKLVLECLNTNDCEQWDTKYFDKYIPKQHSHMIISETNPQSNTLNNNEPFSNPWTEQQKKFISESSFIMFDSYHIKTILLQYKEDMSNHLILMQCLNLFSDIFSKADMPLKLTQLNIIPLSSDCYVMDYHPNMFSYKTLKSQLKKKQMTFNVFFRSHYGDSFEEIQKTFVESIAAYSLFSYVIGINENIFKKIYLDVNGRLALFKFPSFLHTSTSSKINPVFHLPKDFLEVMDGKTSGMLYYYRSLIIRGLIELRKNSESLVTLVGLILKVITITHISPKEKTIIFDAMNKRLLMMKSEEEVVQKIEKMIQDSNY